MVAGTAAIGIACGCAKANSGGMASADASCGNLCDQDGDGVVDGSDQCPNTPPGEPVDHKGCADSQLTPALEPMFPPYALTWTNNGDLGRAGGLTWMYTGIQRGDLFHIYWIVCDDPMTPCGLSLDGPLDAPAEYWAFSSMTGGMIVYTNMTHIALADGTMPALAGRLTITITDANTPMAFANVGTMGVPARLGTQGAEIPGTSFTVTALAEVQDSTGMWTPYLDYYDAAPTAMAGGATAVSFGGSFYDK